MYQVETSFELNPVTKGKQEIFPFITSVSADVAPVYLF